jgi:argininosuccinate lyase
MSGHQMWGGRFTGDPDAAFAALNRSLSVDHRLWPFDIQGSRAWAQALAKAGILTADEERGMLAGLDRVAQRLGAGDPAAEPDEDIHTLVERLLYEEVGDLAGKLHTGRSRNDQAATDLRLWCLDVIGRLDHELAGVGMALVEQARAGLDFIMPGYTHGQRAHPVRWRYVLLSHAWPLVRDRDRLADAARRAAQLPLGSGALAGSGVPVDRPFLAAVLGFHSVTPNALDATGDRDFLVELLGAVALMATHLSRLAAELMTYASSEYGFVRLADAYCTGSSLMPQKRNPDVLELARAKAGVALGDLVGLLAVLKGLPAGYNKDLQEDKAFAFEAVDAALLVLPALRGAIRTLAPMPDRMREALDASLFATDLADALVGRGVPFREAHGIVGRLVREVEQARLDLGRVPPALARQVHASLPELISALGSYSDSVERRATSGGSSRAAVEAQIAELEAGFAGARAAPAPGKRNAVYR